MLDFTTEELALLHSAIIDKRKEEGGGSFMIANPDLHAQYIEDNEKYAELVALEEKLRKIIVGD